MHMAYVFMAWRAWGPVVGSVHTKVECGTVYASGLLLLTDCAKQHSIMH